MLLTSTSACVGTETSNAVFHNSSFQANTEKENVPGTLVGNETPGALTNFGKGYRFDKNGWIYIHIEGAPYERGYQHGYLVAPEIKEILRSLNYLAYWNTGKDWKFFVDAGEKMFTPRIEQEYLEEIKGIADGAKAAGVNVTWQEILAWNAYYELFYSWWPNEMEGKFPSERKEKGHCSAFIATGNTTKDGDIVMAHNTWEDYELAQFSNLILDIVPEKGHHIFMQSLPGYIYSHADFFLSDAGLMGTETAISGLTLYDPEGIPDPLRSRKAMQYADNLDQFAEIMIAGNNGGSADSWLVGDAKTGEIMRLELGLKYYNVTKSKDGYFIGFNAPTDPRIRNLECSNTGYADIRRHQGARQVRLTQLMEQYYGKIDSDVAKIILADHYDVYLKKINPSSRTVDGHYELDTMEYVSDPGGALPFQPSGTVDGLVTNSAMAENLSFWARWGNSAGMPFNASKFLEEHIQWKYLDGYLQDRPSQPWTKFGAGEQPTGP
ncbi:MAG: C45 family autoproteolytic acyltransferase/hydrolase [Methanothrix sp.]|nr:C45 family autoproteolytic acyltransferase/hydrolase [Methanothrix sp.]